VQRAGELWPGAAVQSATWGLDERQLTKKEGKTQMRSESTRAARRPSIRKPIKERFANGKWYPLDTIVEAINGDKKHVLDTINGMSKKELTAAESSANASVPLSNFGFSSRKRQSA
jgi:hypothetical protein